MPGSRRGCGRCPRRPASEQVAWEHAHAAGLLWRPIPGAENAEPPYELRPGTGRRGPAELWARFDAAVAALNRAITGSSAADVADAFGELSEAAGELADAVAEARTSRSRPARSARRRAEQLGGRRGGGRRVRPAPASAASAALPGGSIARLDNRMFTRAEGGQSHNAGTRHDEGERRCLRSS